MSQPVAEWTDERCDVVLATHFEPSPTWKELRRVRLQRNDRLSDGGMWWAEEHHIVGGELDFEIHKHAVAFVKDPAMVLMLLEKLLLEGGLTLQLNGEHYLSSINDRKRIVRVSILSMGKGVSIAPIGRAVAEAYIQAHGLEGK